MDLLLWRHAEAEAGYPDGARPLTAKGRKQAEKLASWLKGRLPADARILASPALRAQQTAAALTNRVETAAALDTGAEAEAILSAAGWPAAGGAVVVVGHQPTLGRVAALLLAGQETDWAIKKGALWWFRQRQGEPRLHAVIASELV